MDIDSEHDNAQLARCKPKVNIPFDFATFNSDVRDAITEHNQASIAQVPPFHNPGALQNDDYAILLNIIVKTFLGESPMTVNNCKGYLWDRDDFISALNSVYVNNNFDSILLNPDMPSHVRKHVPKKEPMTSPSSSGKTVKFQTTTITIPNRNR
ncbi:unnamed protein product [Rhizoctonia solani]|uniref:Uncharacterized protein n=1 Tax=Rhizoctonia solani TaxID=456999 RepID=A0A8H3HLL3_9AGAM|nr:unnamed protein product [Rhizoctonia solani]